MAKESTARRCSHCGINGHNSRTCGGTSGCQKRGEGLMLFGVRIDCAEHEMMRKSQSMDNLMSCVEQSSHEQGYLSDGPVHSSSNRRNEKKRGVPWTEDEHRTFLAGLEKLGKGDWRGISRNFVTTRNPTQVASHAQKYFLRQVNDKRKKRRSSLFDLVTSDNPFSSFLHKPLWESVFLELLLKVYSERTWDKFYIGNWVGTSISEIDKSIVVVPHAFPPLPLSMSCEDTDPNCTKLVAGSSSASETSLPTLSLNSMSEVTNQTGPLYPKAHPQSYGFTYSNPHPPLNLLSPPYLDLETGSPLSSNDHDSTFVPMRSGSCDLELRIALPQPLDSNKFSSPSNNLFETVGVV